MITESYCQTVLAEYPEYITKEQMYRICHISKKTCLFLLESGLVPCVDSGKETHRFKIKTADVVQYLRERDDSPELYKAPDGYYKTAGDKKARLLEKAITQNDLPMIRQYYEELLTSCPDVLSIDQVANFTGYGKTSGRANGAAVFCCVRLIVSLLKSNSLNVSVAMSPPRIPKRVASSSAA